MWGDLAASDYHGLLRFLHHRQRGSYRTSDIVAWSSLDGRTAERQAMRADSPTSKMRPAACDVVQ